MIALSVVSHGQGALVEALLGDLARLASSSISAIVLTRNMPEPRIVVPPSLAARTIVIDNPAPCGFGANHNAAFARCDVPYFCVVNPDIRLDVDPFPALLHRFDRPTVALVAPRIDAPDGRREDSARELITPWRLLLRRLSPSTRKAAATPDWLAGMFCLLSSPAFAATGGFDPRYFLYCEDFDLCARLRLAGWTIVVAEDVGVVHAARRASHRSLRHLAWHAQSLLRMWASPTFWRYRRLLASQGAAGVER